MVATERKSLSLVQMLMSNFIQRTIWFRLVLTQHITPSPSHREQTKSLFFLSSDIEIEEKMLALILTKKVLCRIMRNARQTYVAQELSESDRLFFSTNWIKN